MADEAIPYAVALPSATASVPDSDADSKNKMVPVTDAVLNDAETATGGATDSAVPAPPAPEGKSSEHAAEKDPSTIATSLDKPAIAQDEDDSETKDTRAAAHVEDGGLGVDDSVVSAVDTPTSTAKGKARRKSGVPEHKSKKLNKKASKAKLTHTDAKPGDYFMIRLKGHPLWPGIVCDESMLPTTLIKSRPVTAAGPDGKYRQDYEEGGSKMKDRTFPVMYLHTNEFSWIRNTDLVELDFEEVGKVSANLRPRALYAAHLVAAEKHDLQHFKDILTSFQEAQQAEMEARQAQKELDKAASAGLDSQGASKEKKRKSISKAVVDEDEDVDMADASAEDGSIAKPKKTKKRKEPEGGATPQPSESTKKIKIKLSSNTPKNTNGSSTPKSAGDSAKPKVKKPKPAKAKDAEAATPKEPELSPEEKREKKEKEILFLRHKLQKGLLTRDQVPKEEEMKHMSDFVSKLEGYADLEVSIIRTTKINKVLKAILKLNEIPKEDQYKFKPRSQTLLDKWNKLLASDQAASAPESASNGVEDGVAAEVKPASTESKAALAAPEAVETTNGVKHENFTDKADQPNSQEEVVLSTVETSPAALDAPKEPSKEPTQAEITS